MLLVLCVAAVLGTTGFARAACPLRPPPPCGPVAFTGKVEFACVRVHTQRAGLQGETRPRGAAVRLPAGWALPASRGREGVPARPAPRGKRELKDCRDCADWRGFWQCQGTAREPPGAAGSAGTGLGFRDFRGFRGLREPRGCRECRDWTDYRDSRDLREWRESRDCRGVPGLDGLQGVPGTAGAPGAAARGRARRDGRGPAGSDGADGPRGRGRASGPGRHQRIVRVRLHLQHRGPGDRRRGRRVVQRQRGPHRRHHPCARQHRDHDRDLRDIQDRVLGLGRRAQPVRAVRVQRGARPGRFTAQSLALEQNNGQAIPASCSVPATFSPS